MLSAVAGQPSSDVCTQRSGSSTEPDRTRWRILGTVASWVVDGLAGYQMRYLMGAGVTCVGAHGAAQRS